MKIGNLVRTAVAAILVLSFFPGAAWAGLITNLATSNDPAVQSGTPSGSIFATVKVDAKTANSVSFKVDANNAVLTSDPGSNFGVQKFGFDYDAGATGTITISDLPDGWVVVENKSLDGFGKFEIVFKGTGNARQDPLTFTVTTANSFNGVNGASDIEHAFFEENQQGYHYAAHIAGFNPIGGATSAFFTDGVPIPEAATLLLLGSGLAGLAILRKKSRLSVARAV